MVAPTEVRISLFQSARWLQPLYAEVQSRLAEVIERGTFILGPEVDAFEREFARYLEISHVVGVANGTDAITIALRAVGVRPGDEVVVPSFTFYASVEAVLAAGARPVFCDVDLETRNVTVDTVRAALTPETAAIVAVDLFGSPAPDLRELGPPVIEDAAQAAGASLGGRRAGALGDVATFSFYPSKNLPCFGDGGAVATADDAVAERVRTLRFHGSRDKETFMEVGYNSRLDELQAAVLRLLLPRLGGWSEARRRVASLYEDAGLGEHVSLPMTVSGAQPAWHLYVVAHPRADALISALREARVGARGYYRRPAHRQPALAPYVSGGRSLPATEELARTNLALPMGPMLERSEVEAVVAAVGEAAKRTR
ncbi:MAG: DegT/DnrJ/EryC1/StrS family aminotransferase [Solirubrobacterales bacterium]|nr:DegT/DnrJ/EryC1/StrS family aminotransferase [Solirubrobacterales bacterium]MBV9165781.1 DegT/DnrJ/EryC1/StrS family aminotransferase [Solirubrobacterales bacterium]